jgi:hypothetical protein
MDTALPVTREIHLQQLRPFHESLIAALGEAGVGGMELAEILRRQVTADCVQCGVRVTGEDIAAALAAEDAKSAANPKQARLLQHYCVRKDCPSYFYRFTFEWQAGHEWEKLLARADQLRTGREETKRLELQLVDTRAREARRKRLLQMAAILGAVMMLWAAWRWWITGTPPGVKAKPRYQVNPDSLPPEPVRRAP